MQRIKTLIYELLQSQFIKSVSTLSVGTIISQGVVIMVSPLLTRLYTVQSFGVFSVFTSFVAFLGVLGTGRYEFAIVLPKEGQKAIKLVKLILLIGFAVTLFYLILIFLLKDVFLVHDRTHFLTSDTAYWAPLYVFIGITNTAFGYWILRAKNYKRYTIFNAIQVIGTSLVSVILGFLNLETGMIFALIIGNVVSCSYILFKEKSVITKLRSSGSVLQIAKEYKNFPKFMTLSDLSTTAGQQFVPVLFAALYSTTVVGFYAMANRMLRLPNIIITNSIASVFRNEAIDEIRKKGKCNELYLKTLKKLALLSFPVYALLFLIAPYLFQFIFGKEWYMAGIFARVIAVFLLFEFLSNPLNVLFAIRDRQKVYMILQILNTICGAIMLILGMRWFNDPIWSLILFSANSVVFNTIFLVSSYSISK